MELDVRVLQFERGRCENEAVIESVDGQHSGVLVQTAGVGNERLDNLERPVLMHGQMSFQLFGIAQHFGGNDGRTAAHALHYKANIQRLNILERKINKEINRLSSLSF